MGQRSSYGASSKNRPQPAPPCWPASGAACPPAVSLPATALAVSSTGAFALLSHAAASHPALAFATARSHHSAAVVMAAATAFFARKAQRIPSVKASAVTTDGNTLISKMHSYATNRACISKASMFSRCRQHSGG
eukprot:scaffold11251_cov112-Isochrysis_galbana.AAC.5